MKTESVAIKKTLKIVGGLLLFRFIVGISGMFLEGISGDLQEVSKHILSIKTSMVIDLLTYTAAVATAVLLFPILKPFSYRLSVWFLVFSAIGFANMIEANVNVYTVTKLSQEFISKDNIDTALYQTLAKSKEHDSAMNHFFGLIIHCIGSIAFYLVLFREKLIPRFISVFALVAVLLVITNTFLYIFEVKTTMLMYLPNGILQVLLGIWLMAKGFKYYYPESGEDEKRKTIKSI